MIFSIDPISKPSRVMMFRVNAAGMGGGRMLSVRVWERRAAGGRFGCGCRAVAGGDSPGRQDRPEPAGRRQCIPGRADVVRARGTSLAAGSERDGGRRPTGSGNSWLCDAGHRRTRIQRYASGRAEATGKRLQTHSPGATPDPRSPCAFPGRRSRFDRRSPGAPTNRISCEIVLLRGRGDLVYSPDRFRLADVPPVPGRLGIGPREGNSPCPARRPDSSHPLSATKSWGATRSSGRRSASD